MYNFLMYFSVLCTIVYYCKNTIISKWSKWNQLNVLMSKRTHNKVLIIWYSLCMIYKIIWLRILQYVNTTVVCIGKNKYQVSYVINNKLYTFHTPIHRGPIPILQIIDDNDNDVTRLVLPYMGPQFKGHGTSMAPTPTLLGYKSLTFEMCTGDSYTCLGDDHIIK